MQLWNCSKHRRKNRFNRLALVAMFICGSAMADMRVWEDKKGKAVKAEFVRELFGSVELRRPDGSLHSIPLEELSDQDVRFLRNRIPPEIELEVRTQSTEKVRNLNVTRSEFGQFADDINVITATVQVKQTSRAAFTGSLRAEVYLIGQEVATDHLRLSGKGSSQVQFTEENDRKYTFEFAADFRVYEEYNNLQTRGAKYLGYLVIVIDAAGKKLATETNLPWLLEGDRIDTLRKFHVDAFFDKDCRKKSVPRPLYYDGRTEF